MIMQSQLLVGPISVNGCSGVHSGFLINPGPPSHCATHRNHPNRHRWSPLTVAASSSWAIPDEQEHYAVLGLSRNATFAEIKRAYRLLARKVLHFLYFFYFWVMFGSEKARWESERNFFGLIV